MTLLRHLQAPRPLREHWDEFHRLYAPLLLTWARQQGFQSADALDLAQDVLLIASRRLPTYVRGEGQSFRGWLYTVAVHRAFDLRRKREGRPEVPLPGDGATVPQPHTFLAEESGFRAALVDRACEMIRNDFSPRTWVAFVRVRRQSEPVGRVAADLGMKPQTLYVATGRVLTRLREVVADFLEE